MLENNLVMKVDKATLEKYLEENYDTLRKEYEDHLVDSGRYSRASAEESNDGWEEWLEKDYLQSK